MAVESKKLYNVFWDAQNNVPVIDNSVSRKKDGTNAKGFLYLSTDARPVFLEEKHLLYCMFSEIEKDI